MFGRKPHGGEDIQGRVVGFENKPLEHPVSIEDEYFRTHQTLPPLVEQDESHEAIAARIQATRTLANSTTDRDAVLRFVSEIGYLEEKLNQRENYGR